MFPFIYQSFIILLYLSITFNVLSCIHYLHAFTILFLLSLPPYNYYLAFITYLHLIVYLSLLSHHSFIMSPLLPLLPYIYYLSLFSHHCNYYLASIITIILHLLPLITSYHKYHKEHYTFMLFIISSPSLMSPFVLIMHITLSSFCRYPQVIVIMIY